jgi:nucleoside 2-deoxyribosyltransferase
MRIFIICSVRGASDEYRLKLEEYADTLKAQGHEVHLPHRDTDQTATGFEICGQNAKAIFDADEVHIFYNPESQGTHFDMGVAFAHGKTINVVESEPVKPGKSFENMLKEWEFLKAL